LDLEEGFLEVKEAFFVASPIGSSPMTP